MGQKFFGMHESSRLNMSFKCSGAFNIIYIMRTIIAEGEILDLLILRKKSAKKR